MKIWLYGNLVNPTFIFARTRITRYLAGFKPQKVLDVCTGIGSLPGYLNNHKHTAFGLDIDLSKLSYGIHKKSSRLIGGDATLLPFRGEQLDAVVFTYALHDKKEPMRAEMLREAMRVLKPGGKLIAIDYSRPWDFLSFLGHVLRYIVEALSGHYKNGITFINNGGLMSYTEKGGFTTTFLERHSRLLSASLIIAEKEMN